MAWDFLVAKSDLRRTEFREVEPPPLADGQVRLAIENFALTANNITYAVFGEAMKYWDFFPAPEGFGGADLPPWEDAAEDEPNAAMFSLPLQSLAEAHTTLTTLSAEEWAAMILEAPEGAKNDAKRQWFNLLRWAREVNQALGELD